MESRRFKHALDAGVLAASRHKPARQGEVMMRGSGVGNTKEMEAQKRLLLIQKSLLEAKLERIKDVGRITRTKTVFSERPVRSGVAIER